MPAITLKNIPNELYKAIKKTAEINRRSLNSEIIICLEKTLLPSKMNSDKFLQEVTSLRELTKDHPFSKSQIFEAIQTGRK